MAVLFEAIMVICFGISWPVSVYKSWKSRTAKGKSLFFEVFIWCGYLSGIIGKIVTGNITWVFIIYIINIIMVSTDIILYIRNRKLDREGIEHNWMRTKKTNPKIRLEREEIKE